MAQTTQVTRQNRTLTVDFQDPSTSFELIHDGKAFVEFVFAFILSIGFQLAHKTTCTGGGCLTRHSHYARIRLGGLTIWRLQCTSCQAVFTVLPHFALRYRRMSPDVARQALIATHGGLSLEWCATICHISPMALYRLLCALGQHSLVTVLVKCHLSLPTSILADEKHGRCLTDRVSLPIIVSGRVIWHLGYSDAKSAAAFTASYGQFQQAAGQAGRCLGLGAPGAALHVPRPAAPVSTAHKPAGGGLGSAPAPLCQSHRHDGGRSARHARSPLVQGQKSRRV